MPYADFTHVYVRGTAATLGLVVKSAGTAIDITAWTDIKVLVKASITARDSDALVVLALGSGVTRAVGTVGIATAVIPAASSIAFGNRAKKLFVDVLGVDAAGITYVLSQGEIDFTPNTVSLAKFHPTQILGLKGWLKSDVTVYLDPTLSILATADNAPVGGWKGAGGASRAFVQGRLSRRPLRVPNILNALPIIRSDGVDDFLQGPKVGTFIDPNAFTIFAVAKATNGGTGAVSTWPPLLTDQLNGFVLGFGSAGKLGLLNTTAGTADEAICNYTLGTWAVMEARHATGTIGVRVNGGTEVTHASGTTLLEAGGSTLNIPFSLFSGLAVGTPLLAADLAELLIWNTALTDPDKALVRTYLSGRWGIPSFSATVTPS